MNTIAVSREQLFRKALYLSWFTIIYNLIEGVVSIAFGLSDNSIALAGFGVDSLIEVASAFLVLWRLRVETVGSQKHSVEREKQATFGIGLLFLILGVLTLVSSVYQLAQQNHPSTTVPGLLVSAISLSFMFFLWKAKKGVGLQLDSSTVLKDASCSLACIKLSGVLFAGSLVYLIFPQLWWADSIAAVVISIYILKEGQETISATRKADFDGGCGCHD